MYNWMVLLLWGAAAFLAVHPVAGMDTAAAGTEKGNWTDREGGGEATLQPFELLQTDSTDWRKDR